MIGISHSSQIDDYCVDVSLGIINHPDKLSVKVATGSVCKFQDIN